MIAYYRPLLFASAWQLGAWLSTLALAVRLRPSWAGGVFWGGLVMALNFSLMRLIAHFWHRHRGLSAGVASLIGAKWMLLLGLSAAILHWAEPHGAGLALGMASLFAGIFGAAMHRHASFHPGRGRPAESQSD